LEEREGCAGCRVGIRSDSKRYEDNRRREGERVAMAKGAT